MLRPRAISPYLCVTASDLNLVAHWFGFRNRDEGWDLPFTPQLFREKGNLQGHVTQRPLRHQLATFPWAPAPRHPVSCLTPTCDFIQLVPGHLAS